MFKLMIVDDEETTRSGLSEYVPWPNLGVDQVTVAEDGAQAFQIALEIQPDIVLTDVKMPKMDGIELATRLKERLPHCKVIFLSGYTDKEYLRSAIHLQAIDYIEKPIEISEVKAVVRKTVSILIKEAEQKRIEEFLKNQLHENTILMVEKLALELITPIDDLNQLREKFDRLQLPWYLPVSCLTAVIKFNLAEAKSAMDIQILRGRILKKISERFRESSIQCISGFRNNNEIVVHLYCQINLPNSFQSIFATIKDDLDAILRYNSELFVGIGKKVAGIQSIPESYQTAIQALQKHFYTGSNQVFFYDRPPGGILHFDDETLKKFSDFISAEKQAEVITLISQLVESLREHPATPVNEVKNFFFRLLLSLSKIAEARNILIGEPEAQYLWHVFSQTDTLIEIQTFLLKQIEQFFNSIAERENKSSITYNIMKFIYLHYHEEKLSIKEIADHLELSPNYLCLLFKKETGKTINQYLTEVRIEKAKEFLKDRKTKLYKVAGQVGYIDANYFSKTFKKAVGLNPSEFREKYLQ